MYRRPASRYKRAPYAKKRDEEQEELPVVVESEDIAMPNEAEIPALHLSDSGTDNMSAFRLLGHDFFLDDIILIGLLLILIQENVQDELLLIVIVYILLF